MRLTQSQTRSPFCRCSAVHRWSRRGLWYIDTVHRVARAMRSFRSCQNADSRLVFDELVGVGVSRLKASGAIRFEDPPGRHTVRRAEQTHRRRPDDVPEQRLVGFPSLPTMRPNGQEALARRRRATLQDSASKSSAVPPRGLRLRPKRSSGESAIDPKLTRRLAYRGTVIPKWKFLPQSCTPHYSAPASSQPTRLALSLA